MAFNKKCSTANGANVPQHKKEHVKTSPKIVHSTIEIAKRCIRSGTICAIVALSTIASTHNPNANAANATAPAGWIKSPYGFNIKNDVHVKRFANAVEQVMGSLTANSKELDYTLIARSQRDSSGYGIAYLLNGLSNKGYWFQVGISYDPAGMDSKGPLYIPGFQVVFNIYGPQKNPITIDSNVAGMLNFKNKIADGDKVELKLYFKEGYVVMRVRDLRTNAIATIGYDAKGADIFDGTQLRSNKEGFFSGPMVERHTAISRATNSLPKLDALLRVDFTPKNKSDTPMWVSTDMYTLDSGWIYSFQTASAISHGAASYKESGSVNISTDAHGDVKIKFLNTSDQVMVRYEKDGVFEVGSYKK